MKINWITPKQIAALREVHVYTIYRWIKHDTSMPKPRRDGGCKKPRYTWDEAAIHAWLSSKPKDDECL